MKARSFVTALLFIPVFLLQAAAPLITTQPTDQTADSGNIAEFYAASDSTNGSQIFYQWYHEGTAVPWRSGFSSFALLDLTNVMSSDAGDYWVVITNRFGAATSEVARLTVVMRAPVIMLDPPTTEVCEGQFLALNAGAVGSHPLYYHWQLNGTNLPSGNGRFPDCPPYWGAACNTAQWLISSASQANAGEYRVIFSNDFGARTSAVGRLTVNTSAPRIANQPGTSNVLAGDSVQLYADVRSCQTPHLRWQHNGIDLAANDSPWFFLNQVTEADSGTYSVVAMNNYGAVTGVVAYLTLYEQAPEIVQQPVSQYVQAGNWVSFFVGVRAGPPAAFQWRFNGVSIPHATNDLLYINVVSTNQAGGYSVVATNSLGSATSEVATLTVIDVPPHVLADPISQGVVAGRSLTLTVSASGSPLPTYQWRFNGQNLPAGTNYVLGFSFVSTNASSQSLTFATATTNLAGDYSAVALNEVGSITSRVATVVVSPPGPLDRWHWRNPLPQGSDLLEVGYGNGTFVAVGDDGTKVSSMDGGVTWMDRTEGTGSAGGIAYGNGLFVRAGYDYNRGNVPIIETSPDGIVWTPRFISSENMVLYDVAFGNGRFVAVGYLKTLVSDDGISWAEHSLDYPGFLRVAFGNGMFVASSWNQFATSTNGESWMHRPLNLSVSITDLAFGMGTFVACASVYDPSGPIGTVNGTAFSSTDGITWITNRVAAGFQPSSVSYGNGRFVMVGGSSNGVAAVSTDARNWTATNILQSHQLYGIGFGGGNFVAVGNYGNIITSTDGLTWTARSAGSDVNLRSVTHGRGTYLAVGNEGLWFSSSNGVSWSKRPAPTTSNIRGVTFGNGLSGSPLFVAVGEATADGALVMTSSNGVDWTHLQIPTGLDLYAVTFADGEFVAVGAGILASSNAVNWPVVRAVGKERLNAVTHGSGMFVAVGRSGKILVSGSGNEWAERSSGTTSFLQGVTYGNGRFVAAGRAGTVLTSTNGTQWTVQPTAFYNDIEDITFANNLFLAVGASGFLASSPDGVIWTPHPVHAYRDFRGVTYADGRFLAVGNNEAILQCGFIGPPILRIEAAFTGDGFEFAVEGEASRAYRLQGSSNLREWIDLLSFINNEETTLFWDSAADQLPYRFYRVVSP